MIGDRRMAAVGIEEGNAEFHVILIGLLDYQL